MHAVGRHLPYNRKPVRNDKVTRNTSVLSMDVDMDVDVDVDPKSLMTPRSPPQWRDYLHRCAASELQSHVRKIVENALRLQRERQKTESRHSRANALFRGDLPTEDGIRDLGIRECLRFLVKILPPRLERSHPLLEGDASSLADFLSLPGERGARPGREWSRKDWERELLRISHLAEDYNYDGLTSEAMYNYQSYVSIAFGES